MITTSGQGCRIAELYQQSYGDCTFEPCPMMNILSENLQLSHWETMVNRLRSMPLEAYGGVILTHGSDTLSYSSAMLAYTLQQLPIPVVITAANYIPDDPRSNALDNLRTAVCLIRSVKNGIYTVFRNGGDELTTIFYPTEINEADRQTDRFLPFAGRIIGTGDKQGNITFEANYAPEQYRKKLPLFQTGELHFHRRVLLIHPYPGLSHEDIPLTQDIAAVLYVTYHSGTVSSDALSLLKRCREKNIPLYLCSIKSESKALYETSHRLISRGAIPLYDISTESAYARLLLHCNGALAEAAD